MFFVGAGIRFGCFCNNVFFLLVAFSHHHHFPKKSRLPARASVHLSLRYKRAHNALTLAASSVRNCNQ